MITAPNEEDNDDDDGEAYFPRDLVIMLLLFCS
jgi:hypothetical protein